MFILYNLESKKLPFWLVSQRKGTKKLNNSQRNRESGKYWELRFGSYVNNHCPTVKGENATYLPDILSGRAFVGEGYEVGGWGHWKKLIRKKSYVHFETKQLQTMEEQLPDTWAENPGNLKTQVAVRQLTES